MAIQTIPEQIDNPKCEKARKKRQLKKVVFGSKVFFIPTECHVLSNSQYSCLMTAVAIKKKLDDLFDGEQCYLNKEAMIILTAFGLHNYGGSDEAFEMCIAGAWAALFHHIGYGVDTESFGKGCPSSRTLSR
jgi:hypothetical protein